MSTRLLLRIWRSSGPPGRQRPPDGRLDMVTNGTNILWALFYLGPVLYGAATLAYTLVFLTERGLPQKTARPLLMAAVVVNILFLSAFTAHFGYLPMVTVFQVLGLVGFAMAATYLWVQTWTRTPHNGPFVLSLAFCCQLVSALFPRFEGSVPPVLDNPLFSVHVATAVLGYSAFALSAVYGLTYLLLYKEMRIKRFGLIFSRLPPLAVLDQMNFYAAIVGLIFLTAALTTGLVWAFQTFPDMTLDPKIVVGAATWIYYSATLFGRRFYSWRGPRLAFSSLFGFVILLFSMFTVNSFFSQFHLFT